MGIHILAAYLRRPWNYFVLQLIGNNESMRLLLSHFPSWKLGTLGIHNV